MTSTEPPLDPARVAEETQFLRDVKVAVERVIVGQHSLIEALLIGLLADGHVLLEGVPGLAKTLTVQSLAKAFGGDSRRIQFTPDLLPSDLLGTQVFHPDTQEWSTRKGPIFGHFVLADEVNRAPAKVQSALLEAMEERQVTLAGESHPLPSPFLVLATQNPLEQEGTYALPEAQLDRFMLKVSVGYPTREEEDEIITRMARSSGRPTVEAVARPEQILEARKLCDAIYVDELARRYILDLVHATRRPKEAGLPELETLIHYGASPRASLALTQASRAHALLESRPHVEPRDIKRVGMEVLRHRIIPSFEAEAEEVEVEDIIERIFAKVPIP